MIPLTIALAISGFAALCLAMEKHHLDIFGKGKATPARLLHLRVAGWLLLALSFAAGVADSGWAIGPVLWLGALTGAGLLLVFWLLPYRPRTVVPVAVALPVAAGLWWLGHLLTGVA